MGYSGARGTLIYEKNLKAKISCQTPFNLFILSGLLYTRRPGPTILAKVTIYPARFTALFWLVPKPLHTLGPWAFFHDIANK